MRITARPLVTNALGLATALAAGVALTITVQRWTPAALWWLFSQGDA